MFKGEQLRPEECDEMLKIEVKLSLLGAFSDLDYLITVIRNTQRNFNSSNVTIYRAKIRLQSNQSEEALEDIVQVKKHRHKTCFLRFNDKLNVTHDQIDSPSKQINYFAESSRSLAAILPILLQFV